MAWKKLLFEDLNSFLDFTEIEKPADPVENHLRLYAKDKAGVSTLYYLQDDGTEVEVGAGGDGGGASTALDNLAAVAINASLVPASDSAINLGSSAPKYWANAYIDKIYLNATATLNGTTAGRVDLTGDLKVSGGIGIVDDPDPLYYLRIKGTSATRHMGGYIDVAGTAAGTAVVGVSGYARGQHAGAGSNWTIGLDFIAANQSNYASTAYLRALMVRAYHMGSANLAEFTGLYVGMANYGYGGTSTNAYCAYLSPDGYDATNLYGIRLLDWDNAATNINYLLEIGDPYLRLKSKQGWTPTAYETPLWLAEGVTPTLRQVQWKAGSALVAGDKVLVLV